MAIAALQEITVNQRHFIVRNPVLLVQPRHNGP